MFTLADAIAAGDVARDEVLVCSKAGYLPFDGTYPTNARRWLDETYVASGLVAADDVVGGHAMSPAYLRHQIARSRANLQLDRIDVYYLHNPESQLAALPRRTVMARIGAAFRVLEEAVAAGTIGAYGVATWNAFRVESSARDALDLAGLVALARAEAGDAHHFRMVQLPCNLGMTEAVTARTQTVGNHAGSLVEAADALGLTYGKKMGLIVLPQALKLVIPGLVNSFVGLFKDTSLVLIIGIFDLLGIIQLNLTDAKWFAPNVPMTGYVFAALIFWTICFGISRYSSWLERRLAAGEQR